MCIPCQRARIQQHTQASLSSFPTPDAQFDVIHIDLVGSPSHGYTYLLTCIDRFTRWPEAIPLTLTTAEAVARAFLTGWIARLVYPQLLLRIVEDNLNLNYGTTLRSRTTAYHPQTNGMVERFHRQLKAALKAHLNPEAWIDTLPLVLLGIRTAFKPDLNATVSELVYGTTLRLPGQFFHTSPTPLSDPSNFVDQLKEHLNSLHAVSLQITLC